ncbi:Ada metal-binding domain-containing protein [Ravibacter arvi]|uniref:Ada metal-binding domain-containing protein n=1 Tax=Ravibacter arvi TaxID=2051041 RepID=UPI0031EDC616
MTPNRKDIIHHTDLGQDADERSKAVRALIRKGQITLGGYKKGKIYGLLHCAAGKRMKPENRVFFQDETEALARGYRPCGHCLREKYRSWKAEGRSSP